MMESKSAEPTGEEYAFSPEDLLQIVRKRFWLILLTTILSGSLALTLSLLQTPVYEASIKVLVSQEQQGSAPDNLQSDVQGLQQLTQTMELAVGSRPVADAVIQQLGLEVSTEEFLNDRLSVEQLGETQFIEVRYKDTSAERAQRVANAVGDVFSEQVSQLIPGNDNIVAAVWERATVPSSPVSPNLFLNVALGLVLGVILGIGLAFVMDYLDDSWRSPEEVEKISGVPAFGIIPEFEKHQENVQKSKKGKE